MSYDNFEAHPSSLNLFDDLDPLSVQRPDLSSAPASQGTSQAMVMPAPLGDASMTPPVTLPATTPTVVSPKLPEGNSSSPTGEAASTADQAVGKTKNIHSRRRAMALGVLAAFGIMYYNGDVRLPDAVPSLGAVQAATPGQPADQTVARASGMLNSMIAQADGIRSSTGTFRGIRFPAEVQTMRSDSMLVLSVVVDGTCWYAAIMPGFDRIPRWDPTAMRCSLDRQRTQQSGLDSGR
jgi:hypothetical protein